MRIFPKKRGGGLAKMRRGEWEVLANLPPVRLTCNLTSRSYRGAPLACKARLVFVRSVLAPRTSSAAANPAPLACGARSVSVRSVLAPRTSSAAANPAPLACGARSVPFVRLTHNGLRPFFHEHKRLLENIKFSGAFLFVKNLSGECVSTRYSIISCYRNQVRT